MGVRKNFSTGRQSRHFGCPSQAADDTNANRRSHNALPLLHHKENDPRYCNSPKNALRCQQCFFFTSYKTRWQQYFFSVFASYECLFSHRDLLLSAGAALPATEVCVQQSHAAKRLLS